MSAPAGFPRANRDSDLTFTNGKVIVQRAYSRTPTDTTTNARDAGGHGTSVALVAAGAMVTGPFGPLSGVAPKAWIGAYKVFPDGSDGAPNSQCTYACMPSAGAARPGCGQSLVDRQ